jgi:hypothetical protein
MIKLIIAFFLGFWCMLIVALAKQTYDSSYDRYINQGYKMITQCPEGYYEHRFLSGDKYCFKISDLNTIGK